ncbi:toprim domain-containing protein [Ruegeria arenilitoris]|uniref:toprim domain-containing protein n=1 Tax=Ruegeria arenilitoris TaxID=1173585 RepID=UPI0014817060|nr:toprim domain-containing protein [Ruegeria arenilitoris]
MTYPKLARIHDTPAQLYLERRGVWGELAAETNALRYGREWFAGAVRHVLYARQRDTRTNEPVSMQRTFIDEAGRRLWLPDMKTGKLKKLPKLSLSGIPTGGTAIMLDPFEHVTHGLTIAEGVEAALAVADCWHHRPVWAVTGTMFMKNFEPPLYLDAVTIIADADEPGIAAARACGERLTEQGIEVKIYKSRNEGEDPDELAVRLKKEAANARSA